MGAGGDGLTGSGMSGIRGSGVLRDYTEEDLYDDVIKYREWRKPWIRWFYKIKWFFIDLRFKTWKEYREHELGSK